MPLFAEGAQEVAESKTLTIWSATSAELTEDLVNAFKEEYPDLDVDIITAGSGELITRLQAQQPNPSGDIILGIAQEAFEGNYDLFTGYEVKKDEIPELLKDAKNPPKYYGMSMPIQALMVNTDLLGPSERPTGWADLGNAKYAGQIVMANPSMSGSAYSQIYQMNELLGFDFIRKMVPNVVFVTSSKIVPEAVARGEYAIGVTGDYNIARKIEEGAPVVAVYPTEGTGARFDATGIIKGAANLENAKKFMDWIVTEDALTIVYESRMRRTVHPDVPVPEGLPPLEEVTLVPYDAIEAAEVREDLTMKTVDLIK
jgi:iron(III) transport system substrate-binding protein